MDDGTDFVSGRSASRAVRSKQIFRKGTTSGPRLEYQASSKVTLGPHLVATGALQYIEATSEQTHNGIRLGALLTRCSWP